MTKYQELNKEMRKGLLELGAKEKKYFAPRFSLNHLISRLEKIAKNHAFKFKYIIEIIPGSWIISYRFVAKRNGDRLEFLVGEGETIEGAIENASENVTEACKEWDYKE